MLRKLLAGKELSRGADKSKMPLEGVSSMAAAEQLQAAVISTTSKHREKIQATQQGLHLLPSESLRDYMVEVWEISRRIDQGEDARREFIAFIQRWYERVMFAQAQHERPVSPDFDPSEWPERWFA
jgi:hypothetical protein